tara:strand:- start:65 stop:439 length:375 start_codon:yes stop_codon:yes gene_type:complete
MSKDEDFFMNFNQFNPTALMKRALELGEEWAEADAVASMLEDTKKTLLASITNEFLGQGRNKTTAETMALASKEYLDHIKQLGEARKDKNKTNVKYQTYKVWVGLIQTKEANQRAEMRMGGSTT